MSEHVLLKWAEIGTYPLAISVKYPFHIFVYSFKSELSPSNRKSRRMRSTIFFRITVSLLVSVNNSWTATTIRRDTRSTKGTLNSWRPSLAACRIAVQTCCPISLSLIPAAMCRVDLPSHYWLSWSISGQLVPQFHLKQTSPKWISPACSNRNNNWYVAVWAFWLPLPFPLAFCRNRHFLSPFESWLYESRTLGHRCKHHQTEHQSGWVS